MKMEVNALSGGGSFMSQHIIPEYMPAESSHIEHKESKSDLSKDIWESYSAFANTKGGYIYLGVRESAKETNSEKRFYVVGVDDADKLVHDLVTTLNNPQRVSHNVVKDEDIEILNYGNKRIIRFFVRELEENQKPLYLNNKLEMTFIRQQTSDIKVKVHELKEMIRSSKEILDTKILSHYNLKHLSIVAINRYRSYFRENSPYNEMNSHDLMEALGVIKEDEFGKLGVTIGGLLFFGKYQSILNEFPTFHLDYFVKTDDSVRWLDRVSSGDMEYPDLNIFMYFDIVMSKLRGQVSNPFMLDHNQQRIPVGARREEALREGLANMLTHADYSIDHGVVLTVYRDYFEFKNPGKMRIPIERFFTTNETSVRNPIISTLFRTIRIGERAGSGGIELYQFAKEFALKEPKIESDATTTTLQIWMIDLISATSDLNEVELRVLSFLTKAMIPATRREIQSALSEENKNTILDALRALEEKKLIIKLGNGKATKYSIPYTDEQFVGNLIHTVRMMSKKILQKDIDHRH